MKVLLISVGTRGDVQPFISIGEILQSHGHDVILAAPINYKEWVESYNLQFYSTGENFAELIQTPKVKKALNGSPMAVRRIWREVIIPTTRKMFDASWEAGKDADVIVYHPNVYSAPDVAEKTGAKLIFFSPVPFEPTSEFPLFFFNKSKGKWLNKKTYSLTKLSRFSYRNLLSSWRKEVLGIKPKSKLFLQIGRQTNGIPALQICPISPTVLPRPKDWGPHVKMTGFCFLSSQNGEDWNPTPELSEFLREPTIYIGFGSMTPKNPVEFTRMVINGVKQSKLRVLLCMGWGALKVEEEVSTDKNIFILDEAPHTKLFPLCSAVVHHGGAGTTAIGLKTGKPTWICPFGVDQNLWGNLVFQQGIGPMPVPVSKLTEEVFAKNLKALFETESYQTMATAMGERLEQENGALAAATVIEESKDINVA